MEFTLNRCITIKTKKKLASISTFFASLAIITVCFNVFLGLSMLPLSLILLLFLTFTSFLSYFKVGIFGHIFESFLKFPVYQEKEKIEIVVEQIRHSRYRFNDPFSEEFLKFVTIRVVKRLELI